METYQSLQSVLDQLEAERRDIHGLINLFCADIESLRMRLKNLDNIHFQLKKFKNDNGEFVKPPPKDAVVMVHSYPEGQKIGVIKAIRELTGYGPKEAKQLSEAAFPFMIDPGVVGAWTWTTEQLIASSGYKALVATGAVVSVK